MSTVPISSDGCVCASFPGMHCCMASLWITVVFRSLLIHCKRTPFFFLLRFCAVVCCVDEAIRELHLESSPSRVHWSDMMPFYNGQLHQPLWLFNAGIKSCRYVVDDRRWPKSFNGEIGYWILSLNYLNVAYEIFTKLKFGDCTQSIWVIQIFYLEIGNGARVM